MAPATRLGNKSVTNDIENVLEDIRAELGDLSGFAVVYRDSMGRWDGKTEVPIFTP